MRVIRRRAKYKILNGGFHLVRRRFNLVAAYPESRNRIYLDPANHINLISNDNKKRRKLNRL